VEDPQHRDTRKIPKIKINYFTSLIKWTAVRDLQSPLMHHHAKLRWSWIFLKTREKNKVITQGFSVTFYIFRIFE
jgi:hypothetical protein